MHGLGSAVLRRHGVGGYSHHQRPRAPRNCMSFFALCNAHMVDLAHRTTDVEQLSLWLGLRGV